MKFLINDYSTSWNTEPLYLNATINLFNEFGVESRLYNTSLSLYDNLDKTNPDVYILDIEQISTDLLSYMQDCEEKNKKLKLLINVNKANKDVIKTLSTKFEDIDLDFILFGDQNYDLKSYQTILPAVDLFLAHIKFEKEYTIDKLIFVNNEDEIVDLDGTYHYTSLNQNLKDKVDFMVDISYLQRLFANYEHIIFKNPWYIGTEVCFNTIYTGKKVSFEPMNNETRDKLDLVFKGEKILTSTKNNHTCLHRIKQIATKIGCQQITDNVVQIESKI